MSITDPGTAREDLRCSDVLRASAIIQGEEIAFEVEMARPLVEGMATEITAEFDCDGSEQNGSEFHVEALVGSQFRRNDWIPPTPAGSRPMNLTRTVEGGGSHSGYRPPQPVAPAVLSPPRIDGGRVLFSCPLAPLRALLDRYSSVVGVRLEVLTISMEEPLRMDMACEDEGLPLAVDGDLADWSDPCQRRDDLRETVLVTRYAALSWTGADFDATRVFLAMRFEEPGFATSPAPDPDVSERAVARFIVAPLEGGYSGARVLDVPRGVARGTASDFEWACAGTVLEASHLRRPGEAKYRVLAWTEVERKDLVGGGAWQHLDVGR